MEGKRGKRGKISKIIASRERLLGDSSNNFLVAWVYIFVTDLSSDQNYKILLGYRLNWLSIMVRLRAAELRTRLFTLDLFPYQENCWIITHSVFVRGLTIVPDFLLLLSQWHVNCFQQVCNHSAPKGTSFRIIAAYSRIGETRQTTANQEAEWHF